LSPCSRRPLDLCGLTSGFGEGDGPLDLRGIPSGFGEGEASCERLMAESGDLEWLVDASIDVLVSTGFRGIDKRGGNSGAGLTVPRSTRRFDLRGEAGCSEGGTVLVFSTGPASSTIISSVSIDCRIFSTPGNVLGNRDSLGRGAMVAQHARDKRVLLWCWNREERL
jgi:hypothetical protein